MKEIVILILNYKTHDATIRLCKDLHDQKTNNVLIRYLIVDNASPNGSYDIIKNELSKYSDVQVIKSPRNDGYACGNNYGLTYLKNSPPDYVLIANNDIFIDDNCFIEKLVAEYESLPKDKAFTSPKQLDVNHNELLFNRRIPSFLYDIIDNTLFFRKLRNHFIKKNDSNEHYIESEIIPGALIFVSYALFRSLDFFETSTFLYCEERFLAQKVKQNKFKSYIINTLSYRHIHSKTISDTYSNLHQLKLFNKEKINFTLKYRTFGKIKALILKLNFYFYIFELKLYDTIKGISKN